MKRLFLATVFFSSIMCCSISNAGPRGYVAFRGGLSDVRETALADRHDASLAPSAAVGVYNGPFRAEVEYTHIPELDIEKEYDRDLFTAKFNRVMGNAYIELPISYNVRPFVMGGIGVANYDVNHYGTEVSGSNFAWNVGGGIAFLLNRNVSLDVGGRYVDLGDVELETQNKKMSFDTVETYVGMRFLF